MCWASKHKEPHWAVRQEQVVGPEHARFHQAHQGTCLYLLEQWKVNEGISEKKDTIRHLFLENHSTISLEPNAGFHSGW